MSLERESTVEEVRSNATVPDFDPGDVRETQGTQAHVACSVGRYDGLSESLGGPPAPGIGFAIGEDRLVMSLGKSPEEVLPKPDVYIAPLGSGMNREAARLARELRRKNLIVELGDESFRLKKSLETASKLGARYALIAGENELSTGVFALKNLSTGELKPVSRDQLGGALEN